VISPDEEPPFSLAGEEVPAVPIDDQVDELVTELRTREEYASLFEHPQWPSFLDQVRTKEQAAMTAVRTTCQTIEEFTAMRAMANTCDWVAGEPERNARRIEELHAALDEIEREDTQE